MDSTNMHWVGVILVSITFLCTVNGQDGLEPGDIVLRCGSTSMQVDIPSVILVDTFQSTEIHLLGNLGCRGFTNGIYTSVNSSLTGCGTQYWENATHSFYSNAVINSEATPDAIVEYLSLRVNVTCQYDRLKKLNSSFFTVLKSLSLHERGKFPYDFSIYNESSYRYKEENYPVYTKLGHALFFRAELVRSADNLEIHLRSCYATRSSEPDDDVKYELIANDCGLDNAAVKVLISRDPKQADFELDTFRFKQDTREQKTVWVHCEVFNCDVDDLSSECKQGCEVRRQRRSAGGRYRKSQRIVQGPIRLGDENNDLSAQIPDSNESYSPSIPLPVFLVVILCVMIMSVAFVGVYRKPEGRGNNAAMNKI